MYVWSHCMEFTRVKGGNTRKLFDDDDPCLVKAIIFAKVTTPPTMYINFGGLCGVMITNLLSIDSKLYGVY